MINKKNEFIILSIIQPILLIEEKITIFVREDWEIPPILPTKMLSNEIGGTIQNQDENRMKIGTNFWKVKNRKNLEEGNFLTIGGVQECIGAIPLFNINAKGGTKAVNTDFSL